MLLGSFVLLVFVAGLESHPVGSQGPCNQVQDVLQALEDSSIPSPCSKGRVRAASPDPEEVHDDIVMDIVKECYDKSDCYDQYGDV